MKEIGGKKKNRLGNGCGPLREGQISQLPATLGIEAGHAPARRPRSRDGGQSPSPAACSSVCLRVIRSHGFHLSYAKNVLKKPQKPEMSAQSTRGVGRTRPTSLRRDNKLGAAEGESVLQGFCCMPASDVAGVRGAPPRRCLECGPRLRTAMPSPWLRLPVPPQRVSHCFGHCSDGFPLVFLLWSRRTESLTVPGGTGHLLLPDFLVP